METKKTELGRADAVVEDSVVKKVSMFFYVIMAIGLMASCSKLAEELQPNEPDTESILVEGSPWIFSHYENSAVEDDGGSGLSSQEIEDDMNQYLVGVSFTFNLDGTGFLDIPEEESRDWVWGLDEDVLTTVSETQTNRYTFFSADRNQMTFEGRTTTVHTKDSVPHSVTHVGKYFYK